MYSEVIDKQIEELGFILVEHNEKFQHMVYENEKEDIRVILEYDPDPKESWMQVETISTEKDWFGYKNPEPMCLDITQLTVFLSKLEDLQQNAKEV